MMVILSVSIQNFYQVKSVGTGRLRILLNARICRDNFFRCLIFPPINPIKHEITSVEKIEKQEMCKSVHIL